MGARGEGAVLEVHVNICLLPPTGTAARWENPSLWWENAPQVQKTYASSTKRPPNECKYLLNSCRT